MVSSLALMHRSAGFAYVLLLAVVAIVGILSASAVLVGAQMTRRSAEEHLLYVGGEIERALVSYQSGGPGPKELVDLLRDARVPGVRRYLRRIPFDPLTGEDEWGVERDQAGNIVAVFSLATGAPIRKAGFDAEHAFFVEAQTYRDWRFGVIRRSRSMAAPAAESPLHPDSPASLPSGDQPPLSRTVHWLVQN